MSKKPSLLGRIFTGLSFFFLYAPIFVLIAFSFNSSKSRSIWTGFSLQWYQALMENEAILKKPSIAETLDWAAALDALGVRELTPDALRQTAGFILKNNEDLDAWDALDGEAHDHACSCGGHCGGHHHG